MALSLLASSSTLAPPSPPCDEAPTTSSASFPSSLNSTSRDRCSGLLSFANSSDPSLLRLAMSSSLQMKPASTGYYPASISWWLKGNQPNMRDINSCQQFIDALENSGDKLVLVDFYSSGCRSCKALYPKICQIAAENPDMSVLKVNFYDNEDLCRRLNVNILPFFHIYRGAEGRLDAFSCSLTKINKLRDTIAKHKYGPVATSSAMSIGKATELLVLPTSTTLAAAGSI